MAVYTEVGSEELEAFIVEYDIGGVVACKGIAEGVENSNYLLQTERGTYFLTLYEKRVRSEDLPFFLGLMDHLAARGIACPTPIHGRDGAALRSLAGRPAAIVSFMPGIWIRRPSPQHCAALGAALAQLHLAGADFPQSRPNALALAGWRQVFESCRARADSVRPGLASDLERELDLIGLGWPDVLPTGVIHADLFPDNVLFLENRLSGLIDFYFACNDFFAYDLAICLNAWCFETDGAFNVTKARLMLQAYRNVRSFSGAELHSLPLLARGAALRFLLTRLYDWLNQVPGALVKPKDPIEYLYKLNFHRAVIGPGAYGLDYRVRPERVVDIYTDGACSGNPGPGGWGALLRWDGHERELWGGEPATTNNRMELMAAIMALEVLKRPCQVRLHTDSLYLRDGITRWIHAWKARGWLTADRKPVKNVDLWQRLDAAMARHRIEFLWVRGHSGHPENERADQLARRGVKEIVMGEPG